MRHRLLACAVLLGAVGCGALENEDVAQVEWGLLVDNKALRMNTGKCVLNDTGNFKTLNCPSPFPNGQRFDFDGDTAGGFRVRNNDNQCITAPSTVWEGIAVSTTSGAVCGPSNGYAKWKVKQGGNLNGQFQLQNVRHSTYCMTEDLTLAGPYLRLKTCEASWPANSKQLMFLDPFGSSG
jgi:hypothetical protein